MAMPAESDSAHIGELFEMLNSERACIRPASGQRLGGDDIGGDFNAERSCRYSAGSDAAAAVCHSGSDELPRQLTSYLLRPATGCDAADPSCRATDADHSRCANEAARLCDAA